MITFLCSKYITFGNQTSGQIMSWQERAYGTCKLWVIMANTVLICDNDTYIVSHMCEGAQWLSGTVLDSRLKGRRLEPHRRHCVVVLEQGTFILASYWFNPRRPVPV